MIQELSDQIDGTTGEMLQAVSMFSEEQVHIIPFDGSWTAAQVVEHVLKSESGIVHFWKGNSTVAQRDPSANVNAIESMMLDFDSKMTSPEFVRPSGEVKNPGVLISEFKANREEIKEMAASLDLVHTFTDFYLPQIGPLTGLEWIAFMLSHSKRHTNQLKNIYQHIVSKEI